MSVIICEDLCEDCATNFLKNPLNLGDYEHGGTLLRYCPCCGQMLPFLEKVPGKKEELTQSTKKRIGVRVAKKHSLDYKIMVNLIKDLKKVSDRKDFLAQFRLNVKEVFDLDLNDQQIL